MYFCSAALICDSFSALAPAFCSVVLSVYRVEVGLGGCKETARWCFCLSNCLAATTKSQRTGGRSLGEDKGWGNKGERYILDGEYNKKYYLELGFVITVLSDM